MRASEYDSIFASHSEDAAGRCQVCRTVWPCLVWVSARERYDDDAEQNDDGTSEAAAWLIDGTEV
jgi:hypothetical protein